MVPNPPPSGNHTPITALPPPCTPTHHATDRPDGSGLPSNARQLPGCFVAALEVDVDYTWGCRRRTSCLVHMHVKPTLQVHVAATHLGGAMLLQVGWVEGKGSMVVGWADEFWERR